MTEREKLIELIGQSSMWDLKSQPLLIEQIADYLLANGVIVPPCKVGDIVYSIIRKPSGGHWEDDRYIIDKWGKFKVFERPFNLTLWECGWDGIYLSREEAEKALAERSKG